MRFRFLTAQEASNVLRQEDDYSRNMSQTSLQMLGIRDGNQYLNQVANQTRNWNPQEENTYTNYLNQISQSLENLNINSDVEVLVVKTSGRESMGMPYTRHNAIVLTEPYLQAEAMGMQIPNVNMGLGMVAHEVFHIISRANVNLREELYALSGFEYNPLENAPQGIITNPDAPNSDYSIEVNHNGENKRVTPLLMVNGRLNPMNPMAMMQAMQNADKQLLDENGNVFHRNQTDYMQRIGLNSEYSAYHPEEICAEYFRYLIEGQGFNNQDAFVDILQRAN